VTPRLCCRGTPPILPRSRSPSRGRPRSPSRLPPCQAQPPPAAHPRAPAAGSTASAIVQVSGAEEYSQPTHRSEKLRLSSEPGLQAKISGLHHAARSSSQHPAEPRPWKTSCLGKAMESSPRLRAGFLPAVLLVCLSTPEQEPEFLAHLALSCCGLFVSGVFTKTRGRWSSRLRCPFMSQQPHLHEALVPSPGSRATASSPCTRATCPPALRIYRPSRM